MIRAGPSIISESNRRRPFTRGVRSSSSAFLTPNSEHKLVVQIGQRSYDRLYGDT